MNEQQHNRMCLVCSRMFSATREQLEVANIAKASNAACFCSRDCAGKWRQCEAGRKHKCKKCNKKTGWVRGGRIVCFACARRKAIHTGHCEYCSNEFVKGSENQKYCSMQCARNHKAAKRLRVCRNCKRTFSPKTMRASTFCSRACSGKGELGQQRGKARLLIRQQNAILTALNRRAKRDEQAWRNERKQWCNCGSKATQRRYCDKCAKKRKLRAKRVQNKKYKTFRDTNIRDIVIARDSGVCQFCGIVPKQCTVDHLIPLAKGGTDDASNLVVACRRCNSIKHTKTPLELFNWPKWITYKDRQRERLATGPSGK